MDWIFDVQIWISLLTLTVLEIVLGVDNIIFISILAGRLPQEKQARARTLGLAFALITRLLLLCTLFWLGKMTTPLFTLFGSKISGKDLVLILGGLFLIAKSTHEIHEAIEADEEESKARSARTSLMATVVQIMLIDIVFSLDTVITAIGMVNQLGVMIAAIVLAMIVMLWASGAISNFVNRHPTIKMLALSFLMLIGIVLIADGFGRDIPRGYIYFAMAFSFAVEMLNLKIRAKHNKTAGH